MTLLLTAILTTAAVWAQTGDRFSRYCGQLSTPVPEVTNHANSKVSDLMAVVDAANGTPQAMQDAVKKQLDYEQFKASMHDKHVELNDQFHQADYARAARSGCESIVTESGAGNISTVAHVSPTEEQLNRRVNDSGIGAGNGHDQGGSPAEAEH